MENLTRRDRGKLEREEEIISAAEKVFCSKGFEDASMDEIAKQAKFTKRTVYQYFDSKEDLYFALMLKVFRRLCLYLIQGDTSEHTGYVRIHQFCRNYYQFYKDNPETFRIIGYRGPVKKNIMADNKRLNEFMQFNNSVFQMVAELITQGKKDGSIQPDLDSDKTAFSLIFMMTGFFNQLAATGDSFTTHFSLSIEDFCFYSMDLLFGTLKK